MQFDVYRARIIYERLYESEYKRGFNIDLKREAMLFVKALYIQLYGERIVFCADNDFFINQTPTGYAVTGYCIQENGVKVPFNITVIKNDNDWSPSTNYVSPDTKSVSCSVWLWVAMMAGSALVGLISYLILKASIGF